MIEASLTFPRGFLWGTSTSSHQVEGDNRNNDWWLWEHEGDRILHGHTSGEACGWWAGRWREDFDRAAQDGQNAHRLSLEWSRIEPSPALWDESALETYRAMLEGALERGLMPMVTLHHFTNPIWLMEIGGWENEEVVRYFKRYTEKVLSAIGDLVGLWVTINEPAVYIYAAYGEGVFPPGVKDYRRAAKALKHMIQAHAAAYATIHNRHPRALVGVAHHYRAFQPALVSSPFDRWAVRFRSVNFNDVFPRALADGRMRFLLWKASMPEAKGTQDYFGLNYYTLESFSFNPLRPRSLFAPGFFRKGADLSPTGFIANEPEGFWQALQWAHRAKLPIYITENGTEDDTGRFRPRYLAGHLKQLWRAANYNWDIRGYFHWSLVDNFEWDRGWTQRFGLWALDRETQARVRRPSADLYAAVCRENRLSSEMVAAHSPEMLDDLFPPPGPMELSALDADHAGEIL